MHEEAESSYMEEGDMVCNNDDGEDVDYHDDDDEVVTITENRDTPLIRINRNLTHAIKSACLSVSIGTGLSAEMFRKAVQIISKELYGHSFYLSPEEQTRHEPSLQTEIAESEPESKRFKGPVSVDQWQNYKYVLPSATTIEQYKSLLAAQEEAEAGIALLQSTIHHDTTQRNFINGDWVSMILRFSDKQEFRLRPILMAFETCENIQNFVQETYTRMAAAVSVRLHTNVEPKSLWENTTFFCTDAVSKNHFVGQGVAKYFNSTRVPVFEIR